MERVYTHYLPLVRTICTHGFGRFRGFFDPLDREDAVQSIFMTAFSERTRLSYNGLDPYRSFLRGVAQNVIRRMLDSKTRFDRRPEKADPTPIDTETSYIEAETHALLKRFRASITDHRERVVIERYFCEGWSEEKVAQNLGITRYRTRRVIATLHRRMTRYLKEHGHGSL